MIPLWLISYALKGLGWLKDAARYLCGHPMAAVALLCAIVAGVEHHEANKWARVAEQRGNALKQAQAASVAELARANAERAVFIKHEKDMNDAADRRVELALAADRAAARALVDRLRSEAGARDRQQVPTPSGTAVVESDHRPGATDARPDALSRIMNLCFANTRRLWEAHLEAVPGDKPIEDGQ